MSAGLGWEGGAQETVTCSGRVGCVWRGPPPTPSAEAWHLAAFAIHRDIGVPRPSFSWERWGGGLWIDPDSEIEKVQEEGG